MALKTGKQFVEQMFSGADPISFGGQTACRDRPAQFDVETPAAFINDGTGNHTNCSLILHYSGDAGKEGHAETIPSEPA